MLKSVSKNIQDLTEQFTEFLIKWENINKCFICQKNPGNWNSILYKEKYRGICRSCNGHFWNETHNNKHSVDETIKMLQAIYRD